jgi:hypothetical protein
MRILLQQYFEEIPRRLNNNSSSFFKPSQRYLKFQISLEGTKAQSVQVVIVEPQLILAIKALNIRSISLLFSKTSLKESEVIY